MRRSPKNPVADGASTRAPGRCGWRQAPLPAVAGLVLLGTLAVALTLALHGGDGTAKAEGPTVSVALQSAQSSGGTSTYKVTASGFGPNVSITESVAPGDGVNIAPIKGSTTAGGAFMGMWTFDVSRKYCGTITAATASASAAASFWVAAATDAASGTTCTDPNAGATVSTPAPTATAAPTEAATPAPTTVPPVAARKPAAPPTSGPSGGGSLFAKLGHISLLWIAAGVIGVVLLIVVVFFVAVGIGGNAKEPARYGAAGSGHTSTRRQAVPGAPGVRPGYGQGFGQAFGPGFGSPGGTANRMPRYGPGVGQPPRGTGVGQPQWRSGSMGRVQGGPPRPGGGMAPRPGPVEHRWPDPPRVGQPQPGPRGYTPGRQPTVGNHTMGGSGPRSGGPDPRWARSQVGPRAPGEAMRRDGHRDSNNSRWIR